MIWFVAFFLLIIACPFLAEFFRKPMDAQAREAAPGTIVQLRHGDTHIHVQGPLRGPLAVCVHGLTTPEFVWDEMVKGLVSLGFRVVTYDLYGRGFSDRPNVVHSRELYVSQLDDVLRAVDAPDDVTLFGFSMGGCIASAFAAEHPERIERLVVLAPAGLIHKVDKFNTFIKNTPIIGDWVMRTLGGFFLNTSTPEPGSNHEEIAIRQEREMRFRGFLPAVLSSQRNFLHQSSVPDHQKLENERVLTLGIFGDADEVIPIGALGKLAQANRAAHLETIEGAGHGLPYTHTAEIVEALRAFLQHH